MSKIIGVTVGTTLPKPNFKQTDPTKGDYIKNKPVEMTEYEMINMLIAMDMFPVVEDENGNIMTDETGAILLI